MIWVGPAGYPEGSKGPVDAVERVASLGLSALEVQFVRQAKMAEEKATALGERAKELGVLLSAHAPYYINFNSSNETTVTKSDEWVLKSVRLASLMGARIVVVHAAAYAGKKPAKATQEVLKGVKRCRKVMESESIGDVLIGLETMGKKGSWGTLDEISDVMDEVEGVVPVVDFGHMHARSGGGLRSAEDFLAILDKAGEMSEGHLHCHYSCIEYTEAGERRHLDLKTKQPDFDLFADAIRSWKGSITIVSETPTPVEGAQEMMLALGLRSGKKSRRRTP